MSKLTLFDDTLREGEQLSGVVFSLNQKIELANMFADFGIDYINLMLGVSESEKNLISMLCDQGLGNKLCSITRLNQKDVNAIIDSDLKYVMPFTPLSDIFLDSIVGISREENLDKSISVIDQLRDHGLKIFFAGVDCSRADKSYLTSFVKEISNEVDMFMHCDSMGLYTPGRCARDIQMLREAVPNLEIGIHTHNDFGMAVANMLAAYESGSTTLLTTFNGIGARAGNAAFEEVILALRYLYDQELNVNYNQLAEICGKVEEYSGIPLSPNKPLVGSKVFTHYSGLHVNGLMKNSKTFEFFDPRDIGRKRDVVLGKQSGRTSVKYFLGDINDQLAKEVLDIVKDISEREQRLLSGRDVQNIYEGVRNAHN